MKTFFFFILFIICSHTHTHAQTTIQGKVVDKAGISIIGANVFIEGSYDGSITDLDGRFRFQTSREDNQVLCISYLGYESKQIPGEVNQFNDLVIQLRESSQVMDAVEIAGSTFKAGDNSSLAVLKPMDIVTTAGSLGDVIASFQTLPGTQSNSEDGRLFVRGGDAEETLIFIDGMRVFAPYTNSIVGSPSRGRFSPFLFQGISFSSGGYDAGYGQALSGILDLKTSNEVNQTESNVNVMTLGLGFGHKQSFKNSSISANVNYIDLAPYNWAIPNRVNQKRPYHGVSGEAVFTNKTSHGIFKTYVSGETGNIRFINQGINDESPRSLNINNQNAYLASSYLHTFNDKTSLFAGLSLGQNQELLRLDSTDIDQSFKGLHAKAQITHFFNDHFKCKAGIETVLLSNDLTKNIASIDFSYEDDIYRSLSAAFVESEYFFSPKLALKIGLRSEYHSLFDAFSLGPRMTLAQKINKQQQISVSYGEYVQEPAHHYLFSSTNLSNQKASHLLLNYQFKSKKHIVRVEGYHKRYHSLISYEADAFTIEDLDNNGHGYARGIDLFWRANDVIKNTDCWVSYSWLKSKRMYKDYPSLAMPSFATSHNVSLVSKTWIRTLNTQLSLTYTLASGRPYENPNIDGFMESLSKPYQNLSLSLAYLISAQKILFISISNITRVQNEFGYTYAHSRGTDGLYPGQLIRPNEDQFFFAGFFMTFSRDQKRNQLDQL